MDGHVYTKCYCEENIYKLCEEFLQNNSDAKRGELWVVFISNKNKTIPIWAHRENVDDPVVWDYHVILLEQHKEDRNTLVYDLDSKQHLPFPCNFGTYVKACLKPDMHLRPSYKHAFRVIAAHQYLDTFSSDRTHMINKKDNSTWLSAPPTYPIIQNHGVATNLHHFWTMEGPNKEVPGDVITDIKDFVKMFS